MTSTKEKPPAIVPETATPAGDVRVRWMWAEPAVWTERMLTTLEQGVRGGRWHTLYDKVFAERNLFSSFQRVAGNDGAPGVDYVSVTDFEDRLMENVRKLTAELQSSSYRPQAVRRVNIPKPGTNQTRPLGIPTVRDRTVQGAVRNVIEPIFEHDFAEHSYGFRPKRGCKDALRRVDQLLKEGYVYVVDADLKSYFDTIPHEPLLERVREKVSDRRVLSLIEAFLKAGIMDGLALWTPEEGAPQGAVLSPLLSNIYLDPLDRLMAQSGYAMVRYADDFVILCRTAEEAQAALRRVQEWTASAGLTLHPDKTRIVNERIESFDFLGYRFEHGDHTPRPKSLDKLKDTIREKTPRNSGQSMKFIVANVSQTLRGWFGYFKHSHPHKVLLRIDGWTRMRMRSILRRRIGLKGCGRGADHQRWPNAYFAKLGFFSLEAAWDKASQPSLR